MLKFCASYFCAGLNGFIKTLKNTIIDFVLLPSSAKLTEDFFLTISADGSEEQTRGLLCLS